jgi:CTP:molybdopterin cytidylyltransferase MocA
MGTKEERSAIVGVVLAAGAGTRFGWPKQLAPFRGRPLLGTPCWRWRARACDGGWSCCALDFHLAISGRLCGDVGARALLAEVEVREVNCDDPGGGADIDTPEDRAALERAVQNRAPGA